MSPMPPSEDTPVLYCKCSAVCPTVRHRAARVFMGLFTGLLLASGMSSCSLYSAGQTLINNPLAVLECLPECPSSTEPITLRHRDTGAVVTCGPYPHALYSSMAEVYRLERQQCVTRYQQQGYVYLVKG